ncbi:hypothetical protein [Escherichia coli]|uniref:hypothetical protein n=2 Tax=Escherichia coli TaxID=562 RepID=UPI000B0DFD60|nr:hypothetical protein [Escherichia coli]
MSGNMTTILSCFAALVSAATAIYAIKQSNLQRRLSYKPQLYIEDYRDKYFAPTTNTFDHGINGRPTFNLHELSIINIGNGSAQNIKYKWVYNYSNALKDISSIIEKLGASKNNKINLFNYEVVEHKKIIINDKCFNIHFNFNEKYILPQHQIEGNLKNTIIHLPIILTTVLYNLINLRLLAGETLESVHGPKLVITYQDSGGALITDHFESEFILKSSTQNTSQTIQNVRMTFRKLDRHWTQQSMEP